MKTNKNNSNEVKQFAIGTKIEHNGKLYEVLQDKSCNNCSLASVCSSSDKSSNISGDLLREERIKIFGEVVQCNGYVDKKDFYKHSSRRTGYVIPYNFPLNTRRGFRTIYFLMKLTQHDMTTVIKDIIGVRHAGINFITNICDKLEKENNYLLTSLRGG